MSRCKGMHMRIREEHATGMDTAPKIGGVMELSGYMWVAVALVGY